jgi:anti-anti-sigma factor
MNVNLSIIAEKVTGYEAVEIFHLRGWLDAQSEEQFLSTAQAAYEEGVRFLLLDLSEVDTLTSAGMRAMQKVYQLYSPAGDLASQGRVKLYNVPPHIYHVLNIAGFLQSLHAYESLETALMSISR